MPGFPQGGDRGERDGTRLLCSFEDQFGERRGNEEKWNAVEEEGQDEIGKTVGMRERDATNVWRIWVEAHGGDDVGGVGGELRTGECDAFGRSARGGGNF